MGQSSRVWWNYYKSVGNVMRENAPEVKRPAVEGWPSDAVIQATAYVTRVFDADRRWNEKKLFDKLRQNVGVSELQIAMQIFDWMRKDGRSLTFGTGRESGSVYPVLRPDGININPVVLSTDGKIWLQFGALQGKPIFGPLDKRRELMSRFGAIRGTSFVDTDLERYPSIALSKVAADPEGLPKLLSTLNWIDDEISSHRFSGGSA